ncbi:MAG: sulfatase-like hydrolase/transferase [Planctomycetes bacterium]|nr:sulfatase-like hydrolase/transferase [Planctomycetota bacterium]
MIVIVANGWNAGWLGCYGNEWLSTPQLDRLAVESVIFDQHFTVSPSRDAWFDSLTTGRYPFAVQGSPSYSLFNELREFGTRLVRIHDRRDETEAPGTWDESFAVTITDDCSPGEAMFPVIEKQIKKLAKLDNWLLWIETDRLLPPWSVSMDFFDEYGKGMTPNDDETPAQPWDEPPQGQVDLSDRELERLQGTFASVVTEWDADLGKWIGLFREQGLLDSTAILITSSQGLPLGEHSWIGAGGNDLHEENVHVPMMIRLPGGAHGSLRVPALTESIDLSPTLLEMFGLPIVGHGRSLLPLARAERTKPREYICQGTAGWAGAIRTEEWSLLRTTGPSKIFRKPEDRWEVHDVRTQHFEWAGHLEETLAKFAQAASTVPFVEPVLKHYDDVDEEVESETSDEASPKR